MASMYGGQAAAAGVEGFKSGYNFIDQAQKASDEAKLREEKIKQAQMNTALTQEAFRDAMTPEGQMFQDLSAKVAKQEQQLKQNEAENLRTSIVDTTVITDPKERHRQIESLKTRWKTNPDIAKSLGLQNAETMSILNPSDPRDRQWITESLKARGISPESVGVEANGPEWEDVLTQEIGFYPAIKADGAIIDLNGLAQATGAATMAKPEMQDRLMKNYEELRNRQRKTKQAMLDAVTTGKGEYSPDNQLISPVTGEEVGLDGEKSTTPPKEMVDASMTTSVEPTDYGKRPDGTPKGKGFLGEISMTDGSNKIMTEYSVGINIDGKEIDVPTLVPTLTKAEINHLKSGGKATDAIIEKAAKYARVRIKNGKSPFKEEGEADVQETKDLISSIEGVGAYDQKPNKNGYEGKYQFRFRDAKDTGSRLAKQLGYTAEEIKKDGTKQEELMDAYLTENANSLTRAGIEASPYNLWLSHNQGAAGAKAILKGELTKGIRRNMKNQGVDGKTDKELIANYHAKFAPKMKNEPSAEKTRVTSVIDNEIEKQGAVTTGAPLNDMRMRKIYALLGKTYPSDDKTADVKTFEYLRGIVGDDKAYKAVFGSKNMGTLSTMGKLISEQANFEKGSTEWNKYEEYIVKLNRAGTASDFDMEKWRTRLQELEMKSNPSPEDVQEIAFLKERIRDKMDTPTTQTKRNNLKAMEDAETVLTALAPSLDSFYKSGKELSPGQEATLKQTQRALYEYGSSKDREADKDNIKMMKANQEASKEIDITLKRINYGDLKPMEKGMVDNLVQVMDTKLGEGWGVQKKETIEANIRAGSTLGYLQASLIKAMSGTAASEAEVLRLQNVMQGSNWNNVNSLTIALDEFRQGLIRRQITLKDQLKVSPHDGYNYNKMEGVYTGPMNNSKPLPKPGDMLNGQKVIGINPDTNQFMLEDGSIVEGRN